MYIHIDHMCGINLILKQFFGIHRQCGIKRLGKLFNGLLRGLIML